MKAMLDLLTYVTAAACVGTFIKWSVDNNDRARPLRAMVRAHMRRTVAATRKPHGATSRADNIAPAVGIAALVAFPFLLLLFVAVALGLI